MSGYLRGSTRRGASSSSPQRRGRKSRGGGGGARGATSSTRGGAAASASSQGRGRRSGGTLRGGRALRGSGGRSRAAASSSRSAAASSSSSSSSSSTTTTSTTTTTTTAGPSWADRVKPITPPDTSTSPEKNKSKLSGDSPSWHPVAARSPLSASAASFVAAGSAADEALPLPVPAEHTLQLTPRIVDSIPLSPREDKPPSGNGKAIGSRVTPKRRYDLELPISSLVSKVPDSPGRQAFNNAPAPYPQRGPPQGGPFPGMGGPTAPAGGAPFAGFTSAGPHAPSSGGGGVPRQPTPSRSPGNGAADGSGPEDMIKCHVPFPVPPPSVVRPRVMRPVVDRLRMTVTPEQPHLTQLRVLQYNILADTYALEAAFPYVKRRYLSWEYRCLMLVQEILSYNADIVALQEVDHFQDLLEPLRRYGYSGVFRKRPGNKRDGCAIFYRKQRFQAQEQFFLDFNAHGGTRGGSRGRMRRRGSASSILPQSATAPTSLKRMVSRTPPVSARSRAAIIASARDLTSGGNGDDSSRPARASAPCSPALASPRHLGPSSRAAPSPGGASGADSSGATRGRGSSGGGLSTTNIAFGVYLTTPKGAGLWVITTHLYWDPKKLEIKRHQARMLISRLNQLKSMYDPTVGMLVLGDLNSTPGSPVHSLFSSAPPAPRSKVAKSIHLSVSSPTIGSPQLRSRSSSGGSSKGGADAVDEPADDAYVSDMDDLEEDVDDDEEEEQTVLPSPSPVRPLNLKKAQQFLAGDGELVLQQGSPHLVTMSAKANALVSGALGLGSPLVEDNPSGAGAVRNSMSLNALAATPNAFSSQQWGAPFSGRSAASVSLSSAAASARDNLKLRSVYEQVTEPEFTNFTQKFKGTLDYIFHTEEHFSPICALSLPPKSDLERETALPNSTYPSDHLAVVADLQWRDTPIPPDDCRWGIGCRNLRCRMAHPELCQYGMSCNDSRCSRMHVSPCKYGVTCQSPICQFNHLKCPNGIFPGQCSNYHCMYSHLHHCRFGQMCNRPQCHYYHVGHPLPILPEFLAPPPEMLDSNGAGGGGGGGGGGPMPIPIGRGLGPSAGPGIAGYGMPMMGQGPPQALQFTHEAARQAWSNPNPES